MKDIWNIFLNHFCAVEVACYAGAPNWAGWVVIGVVTTFLAAFILILLNALWHELGG